MKKILIFAFSALSMFSLFGNSADDGIVTVNRSFSLQTGRTNSDYQSKPTKNELANLFDQDWLAQKQRVMVALAEIVTGCDDVFIAEIKGEQNNRNLVQLVTPATPEGFWIEREAVRPMLPDASGKIRYLVGPYLPNGQLIHQQYVAEHFPHLWKYLLKHKERLQARQGVELWYGVNEFRPVQKWVPIDKVLDFKPDQETGHMMFYGAVVAMKPTCQFSEKRAVLKDLQIEARFVGSIGGGVLILDFARDKDETPILVERVAADSEVTVQSHLDFEKYHRELLEAAERYFAGVSQGQATEHQEKQFLISIENIVNIGSMD